MTLNKPKKISTGTPFEFGEHRFHFGEEIVELADSTPLLNNLGALHRKMRRDGYLFIRGFHPQEHAEKAARWTLQAIAQSGGLEPDTPIEEGIIGEANQTFSFFRQTEVAHAKPILDVVDIPRWLSHHVRQTYAKGGHNHSQLGLIDVERILFRLGRRTTRYLPRFPLVRSIKNTTQYRSARDGEIWKRGFVWFTSNRSGIFDRLLFNGTP